MGTAIVIEAGGIVLAAELNDTHTSREIIARLPLHGRANTWGEEIYFSIPIERELENNAREDVEVGEIGYWPSGNAFCLFFGPTPASETDKPRAASAVTILGKISLLSAIGADNFRQPVGHGTAGLGWTNAKLSHQVYGTTPALLVKTFNFCLVNL